MKFKSPNAAPSATVILVAAREAEKQGRLKGAEDLCRQILARQPQNIDALVLLSDVASRTGRTPLAQQLLRTALGHDPVCGRALVRLAGILSTDRGQEEGIELCRRAIEVDPSDVDAHFVLGVCCIIRWRIAEAIEALHKAIEIRPDWGPAHERLGCALQLQGSDQLSIAAYRRAVELMPNVVSGYVALGHLLALQGAVEEAESLYDEADRVAWASLGRLTVLARAYKAQANVGRTEAALRRAVILAPEAEEPWLQLSQLLQEAGRFEEATTLLKEALAHHPENSTYYYELTYAGKVTAAERSLIDSMAKLLERPSLQPGARIQLHYSLGKAYDDLGEYDVAMAHFHNANQIMLSISPVLPGDRVAFANAISTAISVYTRGYFKRYKKLGSSSEEPIFIVGMPRSGTTLIEQMLSSHPDIGAVGEQTYLLAAGDRLVSVTEPPVPENLVELSEGYLRHIRSASNGEARIIDKLPHNFLLCGLIHLTFPNARIIHCRRNPIDTCLSIYVTSLTVDFTNSFSDIAFAYREYQRLMEHWRKTLPTNRFFELDYEAIVANPETIQRQLVEFLGLPWNDVVLRHEANSRSVNTASRWQVRQPVHTAAVERWRRYEPWIEELLEAFPDVASDPSYRNKALLL